MKLVYKIFARLMKQCPLCRTTYTDDSLRYCLADGTVLLHLDREQETVVGKRNAADRLETPREHQAGAHSVSQKAPRRSSAAKTVLIITALGMAIFFAAVVIGALIYFGSNRGDDKTNNNSVVNISPTPDAEKQRLQDELANIQKRLDDQQKNANRAGVVSLSPTPGNKPGVVTARVNSPKDGFLALRKEPDADYGERLVKIPHGAVITIENCERSPVVIGGRSGRWCLVSWGGYEGYVFDAWLVY